jgi:osmotically-inducible protein OsmY
MADRWMEERDRRWRERDQRRSDDYGRGDQRRFEGGEDRSWGGPAEDDRGPYGGRGGGRDRVFGERETGMGYGGEGRGGRSGGGYGAGGYRGGPSGRQGGGRPDWQDRDYQGVSPAMQHGEYDLERRAERHQREHPVGYERGGYQGGGYQGGGRFYGDAGREQIYREEWSQGARDTGPAPRGYDSVRDTDHDRGHFDEDYESRMFSSGVTSGGTGGYDYERGYGDGGRQRYEGQYGGQYGMSRDEGRRRDERGQRWEQRGREAGRDTGDFFRKAGERVASWFGGDERRRDDRDRSRDFRGMGPKGYKRNDERISDEVHERLTDDPYVDASNVQISVSAGEVTLSGTVESREAKHRAERCIEDVSGVNHVQNNLRIERGNPLTSPGRGYGDSVLDHQMRGETGAGDSMSGLGGTGSTAGETPRPSGGNGGSTGSSRTSGASGSTSSTSTDTGKSR